MACRWFVRVNTRPSFTWASSASLYPFGGLGCSLGYSKPQHILASNPRELSFPLILSEAVCFCTSVDGSVDGAILARVQSRLPQFMTPFHVMPSPHHPHTTQAVSAAGSEPSHPTIPAFLTSYSSSPRYQDIYHSQSSKENNDLTM